MASTGKVRVASLGSGIFAKEAHLPAIAELQGTLQLVANWSRSAKSADEYKEYVHTTHGLEVDVYHGDEGLKEVLSRKDIEAVIIALPITSQPDIVLQCLDAGKHVLSEKPVAENIKRAKEIIDIYETKYSPKGLVWEIAEQFYYEPRYQRVKQILDSGKLGKITFFTQSVMVNMEAGSKYHSTSWRTVPDYQGGFLLDGGVHFVAGIAVMFGGIKSVTGTSSLAWEHLAPTDTITAICTTDSGVNGTLLMSMGAGPTLKSLQTLIAGENGHIDLSGGFLSGGSDDWTLTTHIRDEAPQVEMFPSRGIFLEIENFVQTVAAVKNGSAKAQSTTIRRAIKDVGFIEACVNGGNTTSRLDSLY